MYWYMISSFEIPGVYVSCESVCPAFTETGENHSNLTINQLWDFLVIFDVSTCFIVYYPGQSAWGHNLPDRHGICWLHSQHRYQKKRTWADDFGMCVSLLNTCSSPLLCPLYSDLWFYFQGSLVYTIFWANHDKPIFNTLNWEFLTFFLIPRRISWGCCCSQGLRLANVKKNKCDWEGNHSAQKRVLLVLWIYQRKFSSRTS